MYVKKKEWETYEDVARQLIDDIKFHLGLSLVNEDKRKFKKNDGGECEVDVSAYDMSDEKLVLVECRKKKEPLSQEEVHGFAYRIQQTNAKRGIIVTTIGLQQGARIAADGAKIALIRLDGNSAKQEYIAKITQQIFVKVTDTFNGISCVGGISTVTNHLPIMEQALKRLQQQTNRTQFSNIELEEEIVNIQKEL
ncbi:restriction endonuclease [Nostoc sp.]|uniref:restriction endonuclease n=1 Tax=Nostoc sp. TaxID=1180 RepID=UPI002FF68D6B